MSCPGLRTPSLAGCCAGASFPASGGATWAVLCWPTAAPTRSAPAARRNAGRRWGRWCRRWSAPSAPEPHLATPAVPSRACNPLHIISSCSLSTALVSQLRLLKSFLQRIAGCYRGQGCFACRAKAGCVEEVASAVTTEWAAMLARVGAVSQLRVVNGRSVRGSFRGCSRMDGGPGSEENCAQENGPSRQHEQEYDKAGWQASGGAARGRAVLHVGLS